MPENQAVFLGGLNLGVLRILLFQGRAESPMERLAQGKRSGTLGWVIVSKTIYALKGQKRGYCAFVSHTQCLLGFQPEYFKLSRSAMFLCFYAFALSGRGYYIFVSHTQGAASLALGWALHWAFSPPRMPLRLPWVIVKQKKNEDTHSLSIGHEDLRFSQTTSV